MASTADIYKMFPTEEDCIQYLFTKVKKPELCPDCGRTQKYLYYNKHTKGYVCACGQYWVYPRTLTVAFANTRLPLQKIFLVVAMMSRNVYKAAKIVKEVGISMPAAYSLQQVILNIMEKNLKDKKDLKRWNEKLSDSFHHVWPENRHLYLCYAQYLYEQSKIKEDAFYRLLDLCIG